MLKNSCRRKKAHRTYSSDIRECKCSKLAPKTISKLILSFTPHSIEIKKCSLKVLKTLAVARDDAKTEILDNGVIDQCLTYI